MSQEIELKLVVNRHFADFLSQEMTAFQVIEQKQLLLGNCYYDTEQGFLAQCKMGLRVRSENGKYTLTLKTNGQVQGGLHIRPEYNVELESPFPEVADLKKLAELTALEDIDFVALQQQLKPIFQTDFQRQLWHVRLGNGAEVEVALDQGQIVANAQTEDICEVEFELKSGKIEDLLTFVDGLSFTDGVRLSGLSKAQRGYRLAGMLSAPPRDWIAQWRQLLEAEKSAVNSTQKLTALFEHEQQLIEDTLSLDKDSITQDFVKTVERVGAFFNLYFHYVENAKLFEQVLAEKTAQSPHFDHEMIEQVVESNERLLSKVKGIITQHSEQKDNHKALKQLIEMVQVGRYVNRMIQLIRLTR